MALIKPLMAALLMAAQANPSSPPAQGRCLTQDQAAIVAISVLPFFIDNARAHCGQFLPASAFIMTAGGADMAAALRREGEAHHEAVAAAFRAMSRQQTLPPDVSDATFLEMVGETVAARLMPSPDAQSCRAFNDLVEALAPLPPERIARFAGALFAMAIRGRHHQDPGEMAPARPHLEICPS